MNPPNARSLSITTFRQGIPIFLRTAAASLGLSYIGCLRNVQTTVTLQLSVFAASVCEACDQKKAVCTCTCLKTFATRFQVRFAT